MPSFLEWTWNALISKFVSENTLRKINITGEPTNPDMWDHIHPDTIETKYGGKMASLVGPYWPPQIKLLLFSRPISSNQHKLLSVDLYRTAYQEGKLANRKVLAKLVEEPQEKVQNTQTHSRNK